LKNFVKGKYPFNKSQKKLFFLLYPFAFRVCVRYTKFGQDPNVSLYAGFARFFSDGEHQLIGNVDEIGASLKKILIGLCIENERHSGTDLHSRTESVFELGTHSRGEAQAQSSRQIIDTLRKIPFLPRVVYNLSVIDGFSDQQISLTLNIPQSSVSSYVFEARSLVRDAVEQFAMEENVWNAWDRKAIKRKTI
jgi:RNA polymerase sigma-70 factor (ECF subfamily)